MKITIKIFLKVVQKIKEKWLGLLDYCYRVDMPSKFKLCGNNFYIYYPAQISGFENIEIGNNVHINRKATIRGEGGLRIGDNVHISQNFVLYTINHNYAGNALPYDDTMLHKPVVIEKNVWIGINVTIIPGVTIGEGAIIGAGTVVSKNIPPLAIVGSAPTRIIKYRDKDHYMNLVNGKKYGGVNGYFL